MTQLPQLQGPVVEVRPQPNVYTVLVIVAILALATALVLCVLRLTGDVSAGGYGLTFSDLFSAAPPAGQ